MDKNRIQIDNMTIQYGITIVRELLNEGYSISAFEQIIEEPTMAMCNLNKNDKKIASLYFYAIKEMITIDQLDNIPIDLVLPLSKQKPVKNRNLSPSQALKNRILCTCLIHLFAAALFFCVYAIPALFSWVQNTEFHAMAGRAPIGMVLLILPALLITFIWSGSLIGARGMVLKKILLSLWLIVNVAVSLTYLVLVDNYFTHHFF